MVRSNGSAFERVGGVALLVLGIGGCASSPRGGDDTSPPATGNPGASHGGAGSSFPGAGGPSDAAAPPATIDSGTEDTGGPIADAGPGDVASPVDSSPPQACQYPPGPYGLTQGSVVDPSLSWQGYLGGSSQVTTIAITDFFDCDGTKGINAIAIDESATWCGACQQEAPAVDQLMNGTWGQEGVRALTLMVEDATQGTPATTQTASDWIQMFAITKTDVAADPQFTFGSPGVNGLPTNVVIDPRTMSIVAVLQGYDPSDTTVDMLAQKNAHH